MTQNLNHYEKILSRSHSNYLAQISIEMTDANNQINDVLSKLTALGTVLIPMNLVTGLWGMNVHVPGQDVPVSLQIVAMLRPTNCSLFRDTTGLLLSSPAWQHSRSSEDTAPINSWFASNDDDIRSSMGYRCFSNTFHSTILIIRLVIMIIHGVILLAQL